MSELVIRVAQELRPADLEREARGPNANGSEKSG